MRCFFIRPFLAAFTKITTPRYSCFKMVLGAGNAGLTTKERHESFTKWIPHCRVGFMNLYLETKPPRLSLNRHGTVLKVAVNESWIPTVGTRNQIQHSLTVSICRIFNLANINNRISKSIGFSLSYHFSIIIINAH